MTTHKNSDIKFFPDGLTQEEYIKKLVSENDDLKLQLNFSRSKHEQIRKILTDGGVPIGIFPDDQVRNLIYAYSELEERIKSYFFFINYAAAFLRRSQFEVADLFMREAARTTIRVEEFARLTPLLYSESVKWEDSGQRSPTGN